MLTPEAGCFLTHQPSMGCCHVVISMGPALACAGRECCSRHLRNHLYPDVTSSWQAVQEVDPQGRDWK